MISCGINVGPGRHVPRARIDGLWSNQTLVGKAVANIATAIRMQASEYRCSAQTSRRDKREEDSKTQ